jgi:DNA-binding FadR family transcriptional regulator
MTTVSAADHVVMPTAAQLVADAIRRQIVTGELADGESLPPEATLIEQYASSSRNRSSPFVAAAGAVRA